MIVNYSPHDAVTKLLIPAWAKWGQRCGAIVKQPEGRGPNSRRLCRWCAKEVGPRKSTFCSKGCVDQYLCVSTWQALAETVRRRDKRCQLCKSGHPGWMRYDWHESWRERMALRRPPWDGPACPMTRAPWQCDHIKPVAEGGTDHPATLRLLCYPCHLHVTREWRRARRRPGDELRVTMHESVTAWSRRPIKNARHEPNFPAHATVTFTLADPNLVAHFESGRCKTQEPHHIDDCGEFDRDD